MLAVILCFTLFAIFAAARFNSERVSTLCTITPDSSRGDDSGAIVETFERCSRDSTIVFTEGTFHIERVMVTTGLHNVRIDMKGTLLVCSYKVCEYFLTLS